MLRRRRRLFRRSGIFPAPFHATNENPTLALERDLDLLPHLDAELGVDPQASLRRHGVHRQLEMFIAAAERTRHIRLRTDVSSPPHCGPMCKHVPRRSMAYWRGSMRRLDRSSCCAVSMKVSCLAAPGRMCPWKSAPASANCSTATTSRRCSDRRLPMPEIPGCVKASRQTRR